MNLLALENRANEASRRPWPPGIHEAIKLVLRRLYRYHETRLYIEALTCQIPAAFIFIFSGYHVTTPILVFIHTSSPGHTIYICFLSSPSSLRDWVRSMDVLCTRLRNMQPHKCWLFADGILVLAVVTRFLKQSTELRAKCIFPSNKCI